MAFTGGGFAFASWASRIPQVRAQLHVSPGVLGLVLLCIALGSTVAIPLAGPVIVRAGEAVTVTITSLITATGLAVVAAGYQHGIAPVAAGLFLLGFGTGSWDVAMNVQGARVERAIGATIMPKLHAGWSIGTVAGAGTGTAMVAAGVPVTVHLLAVAVLTAVTVPGAARGFLPAPAVLASPASAGLAADSARSRQPRHPLAAWTERRTLLIGLVGFGRYLPAAMAGAVLMGLGTSLGFPVGMSASADDPQHAAGRVAVTSSIGYGAFLAGPPLIGFIADHVGVLHALTVTGVLLVIALFASRATAPSSSVPSGDVSTVPRGDSHAHVPH